MTNVERHTTGIKVWRLTRRAALEMELLFFLQIQNFKNQLNSNVQSVHVTFLLKSLEMLMSSVFMKVERLQIIFLSFSLFALLLSKLLLTGVEKPFDCHMCDKQFQRYQQLSDHLKSIHHITKLDLDQSTSKDHSNDGMELNRTNNSPSAASPDPDNDWVPQEADELHANCSDSDSENETGRTVKRNSKVKGEEKKKQPEKRGKMIGPKRRKRPSILPTKKRAPITQIYRCSHEGCNKKFHLEVQRDGHLKQTHEGS